MLLALGHLDAYFDRIGKINASVLEGEWSDADPLVYHGQVLRPPGFLQHPAYLELVDWYRWAEIWDLLGPPDRCRKQEAKWACE